MADVLGEAERLLALPWGKRTRWKRVALIKGSATLGQHSDKLHGESSNGWAEKHWDRTAGC